MANVNPKDAQLVNEHLVQCLRDSVMVQNQTQIVHWGLLGSKFYQIHLLTGDIQTEMIEGIDNIAEHIRSVNVMTPVSVADLLSSRIKDLDVTKRPLHCTDLKRETMYIKDNDEWSKDTPENSKLHNMISIVSKQNYGTLPF